MTPHRRHLIGGTICVFFFAMLVSTAVEVLGAEITGACLLMLLVGMLACTPVRHRRVR